MVYTSGYCIRIYYNPQNPEEKILRVILRAANRIEAADRRGRRRQEGDGRRILFQRENISSKQKQDELPAHRMKQRQRAKPTRKEFRGENKENEVGKEAQVEEVASFLYSNLNF